MTATNPTASTPNPKWLPEPRTSDFVNQVGCLISDVDGIMTDGRIIHDSAGVETKAFHVHDGLAIRRWIASGFGFCVITARGGPAVDNRMRELGVTNVHSFCTNKAETAQSWLQKSGYTFDQAIYLGDDLADLGAMLRCGLAIAPADATSDVLRLAHRVTRAGGGQGMVREVIEWVMRSMGIWNMPDGVPDRPSDGPKL